MFVTWFDFTQTCLYINVLYWKLFLWNFRSFMGFYFKFKTQVSSPENLPTMLWRSTGPRVGRPTCTKRARLASHLGRSTERSTDCKYPTLGWGRSTDRSTVRRGRSTERSTGQRAFALWIGMVDRRLQRSLFWPLAVDWAGRPPAAWADKSAQRLVSHGGLYKPHLYGIFSMIFRAKNFRSLPLF